jgi:DNA (cytosine-5)-methyltransferase 1
MGQSMPRLLDLFCGAGGAAMGYHRAGFHVVGVDIEDQPNYPFEFVRDDALRFMDAGLWEEWGIMAIHASPPCQDYVQWQGINKARNGSAPEHPRLIEPVRKLLIRSGVPWVIENVVGAPLLNSVLLCGSMFGLGVRRHRLFESSELLLRPGCSHTGDEIAVYGKLDGRRIWTRADGTEVRAARTLEQAHKAMGIDWMTWDELREAIPPAYTEYIGGQLRTHLRVGVSADFRSARDNESVGEEGK